MAISLKEHFTFHLDTMKRLEMNGLIFSFIEYFLYPTIHSVLEQMVLQQLQESLKTGKFILSLSWMRGR